MHELKRIVGFFTCSSCISSVCKMKQIRYLVFACISQGQALGFFMYLPRLGLKN